MNGEAAYLSLDFCQVCGVRVRDAEGGGYEREDGQRGHFACAPMDADDE